MEKLEWAIKNREKYIDFIENVLNMPFTKYCKMTDKAYSNMQKKTNEDNLSLYMDRK